MNFTRLLGTACAGLMFLGTTGIASAAFVLTIDDPTTGGTDVTVTDDNSDGLITYSDTIGGFLVQVATGISKPSTTSPQLLFLNSVSVSGGSSSSPASLIISLTDTDYVDSPPALNAIYSGGTIGSVNFDFLYDASNGEFGGTSFFNSGVITSNPFSGVNVAIPGIPSGLYSLTMTAEVYHNGDGVTSFTSEIQSVPVPAAVWLFGSGLLGLVGVARRKS